MGSPYSNPLCRDTDPQTSGEAAGLAILDGTVATHEGAILAVLAEMPDGGTGREIAYEVRRRFKLPLNSVQIMRRMWPLVERGEVERRVDPREPWRLDHKGRRVPNHLRRDGQILHFRIRPRRQLELF